MRGSRRERAGEPLLQLGPRDRVERAERLVEQQDRLAGEQRAGERDPLAHAAGELVAARSGELLQPEPLEERERPPARLAAAHAAQLERQRGIVERAAPGQQQVALRHQRAAAEALGARPAPSTATSPRGRLLQGRRRARAASTCRSRTARRSRAARPRSGLERQLAKRRHVAALPREYLRNSRYLDRQPARRLSAPFREPLSRLVVLPSRALPHRFEGSAPGSCEALSQPAFPRAPLTCTWSAECSRPRGSCNRCPVMEDSRPDRSTFAACACSGS